jgi:hypothetical protein
MSWDLEDLLVAVREQLKGEVTALADHAYVVADENDFPPEAPPPFATVWDAGTAFMDPDNQEILADHRIGVSVFVQNLRSREAPLVGDAAGAPGIQTLTADVFTALKDEMLSLSVWALVRPVSAGPTRRWIQADGPDEMIQKSTTWRYRQKPSI